MIKNFFDLLTDARNLLYQKKNLYIKVLDARIESSPESTQILGQFVAHIKPPTTIKLTTEYSDPYNKIEVEYIIPESDLEDGSEVDKVAKIPSSMNDEQKVALRLAFILYDGHRFTLKHAQLKSLLDQGWRTRVTNIRITHSK